MNPIYLDNAATSRDKPPSVLQAMLLAASLGASAGRGAYEAALEAGRIVLEARGALRSLFSAQRLEGVVFTYNVTYAINMLLYGLLKPGDHVVTSSMEHNSVLRPLRALEALGVSHDVVFCDPEGRLRAADIEGALKKNTKLILLTHASNVTGTLLPVGEVGAIAKRRGVFFAVDVAQTAGVFPLDMERDSISAIAFTGHKTLLGPPGTGGLVLDPSLFSEVRSFVQGGTGSRSESLTQPEFFPDALESGTLNTWGIAGLKAGVEYVLANQEEIRSHERELGEHFLEGVEGMSSVKVFGPKKEDKTATYSFVLEGLDCGEVSSTLEERYGILTRSGLHCAPRAHETIGTFPKGTVRVSFGCYTTHEEVDHLLRALRELG